MSDAVFIERQNCINCSSANLSEISSGRYTDEPLNSFLRADPWGEDPMPFLQSATWSLVRCKDCSQVFHRRILNEEWNERRFSQWMSADALKEFDSRQGEADRMTFTVAIHHVEHILRIDTLMRDTHAGGALRLLDFGCGCGKFVEACRHFGLNAFGIDRSIGRRSTANVEIYPSLDEIPDTKFHVITLFEVLEHLDNPSLILKALASHLVDDGILVVETPDCRGVTGIHTLEDYRAVHPLEHIMYSRTRP